MNIERSRARFERRVGGFTLIEMILGVTVLAILARMLIGASESIGNFTETGNIEARIQRESERALTQIMLDLRMSGFEEVASRDYPYVFDDGAAAGAFAEFTYTPGPQTAQAGEADFGPVRSIVLCMPSDLDGNGRPELDADGNGIPELDGNGDGIPTDDPADVNGIWNANEVSIPDQAKRLVWTHEDVAYVLLPGPTGENELVRLVANGAGGRRVVARAVERIQFDTPATAPAEVPLGSVRAQIFFRVSDSDGRVFRSSSEAVVRLKNGN